MTHREQPWQLWRRRVHPYTSTTLICLTYLFFLHKWRFWCWQHEWQNDICSLAPRLASRPCSSSHLCHHPAACCLYVFTWMNSLVSPCRPGARWLLFAMQMLHVKTCECSGGPPARCETGAISLSPQTCGKGHGETKAQLHICIHTAGQV